MMILIRNGFLLEMASNKVYQKYRYTDTLAIIHSEWSAGKWLTMKLVAPFIHHYLFLMNLGPGITLV
jgi:hypothetical protein